MSPGRVAIVGYGLAGRFFHRPLIGAVDGLTVTHVVTANAERRKHAARDVPTAALVAQVGELWRQADGFDVAVIATANESHMGIATGAIELGKAVVVDKPLALTSKQARSLAEQADRHGVCLSAFHNRRWDSDMLTVRQLLSEAALGRVHRFESRFQRFRPVLDAARWREQSPSAGGGVLLDLGTHLVDQAMHLFGPVEQVYAEIGVRRARAIADDDAFISLRHADGVVSHLWCSLAAPTNGPRVLVEGSAAGYVKASLDGQEAALRSGWEPAAGPWGAEPPGVLIDELGEHPVPSAAGAWIEFYRQFASALDGTGDVPVPGGDAVAVLSVLEAARKSAARREVVSLEA
jgi:predicted dehydrogenase